MKIEWAHRARTDLEDLQTYIAKDSPLYARQFVERILGAVEKLSAHPHIGRTVPEANREDVRELLFRHYRIIYLIASTRIIIVTVLHGSRELSAEKVYPWEVV